MTNRQREYLKLSIESFIEDGIPVASSHLLTKYKLQISSATIRSEMNALEDEGFLEKAHTSSGRIPTTKGYDYFARNLSSNTNKKIEAKIADLFAERRASIDVTLDKAASAISEIAGLTLVTSSSDSEETLKSIQLTPLDETKAMVVMVTSTAKVQTKLLNFNENVKADDVKVAIRLFKERLVDSKLRDLPAKIDALAPILAESVKNFEELIQTFISSIFDFHKRITNNIYGNTNLIKSESIERADLAKLINLIENKSVWSSIEGKLDEDETIKIDIRNNNTSIISKRLETKEGSKEISIVGSNRMDYSDAKQAIKILESILKGENNGK